MPAWNDTLTALNNRLAELYYTTDDIRKLLLKAAIDPGNIRFDGAARTDWFNVLYYVNNTQEVPQLLKAITSLEERGKNDDFLKGILFNWTNNLQPVALSALVDRDLAKLSAAEPKEKILGQQSTLLPISFLRRGIESAQAVVRIQIGRVLGSGFLIADNYIVTNHHVISSKSKAADAQIQFNYETNADGLPIVYDTWKLDCKADFVLNQEHDYAIFKLQGNANEVYGQLILSVTTPQKDEFVNIIQHPMGGPKQLALYHNLVTFADENILHYLTDTMPGSSGSPVFNSDWEVVAIHRAGGELRQPGATHSIIGNAGTNIKRIHQALSSLA